MSPQCPQHGYTMLRPPQKSKFRPKSGRDGETKPRARWRDKAESKIELKKNEITKRQVKKRYQGCKLNPPIATPKEYEIFLNFLQLPPFPPHGGAGDAR